MNVNIKSKSEIARFSIGATLTVPLFVAIVFSGSKIREHCRTHTSH